MMDDPMVYICSLALGMARVSMALGTLPFASRNWAGMPVILPMALAVAILVPAPLSSVPTAPQMILLIAKEAAVGLALGMLISRVFLAVAASGALLDQQAGYTFGATLNPTANMTTGPIESLYISLLTLMLFSDAGASTLGKGVAASFVGWPALDMLPAHGWSLNDLSENLLGTQGQLMYELVMRLAGPAIALLLLSDVTLVVASRYAQQLNPFTISLALKAFVMCLILGWMVKGQAGEWMRMLDAAVPLP